MAHEQCRLASCELPGTLRGGFCSEAHRDENKRAGWRRRKREQREREADSILGGALAASDGRSYPGVNVSNEVWQRTEHHPSRKFARPELPELVDYTGSAGRPGVHERPAPRTDLQRYRPPTVEEQTWAPQGDEDYYGGVTFPRNDMTAGPYRGGPAFAGNPVAFEIRRVNR